MPIRIEEWDTGRKVVMRASSVSPFLKENNRSAYTETEIINALYKASYNSFAELLGSFASFYLVNAALDRLVKEGKVKSKVIETRNGTEVYFRLA